LWLVLTVVFVVQRFSGDPVRLLLPSDAPEAQVAALRSDLGLDAPIPVQYVRFIGQVAQGDLGNSMRFNQPALDLVLSRFPATATLALVAFVVAAVLGLTIGSLAALARNSPLDRIAMAAMSFFRPRPPSFSGS